MSQEASTQAERLDYIRDYAGAFEQSPVRDIAEWVRSGSPPPSAELREAGLDRWSSFGKQGPELKRLFERSEQLHKARSVFVQLWGFSIPCAEAVGALRGLGPLVEIGAGTGYWSALLTAAGADVIATDANTGRSEYGFQLGVHHPLHKMTATEAVVAHPNRDVFCSWPAYEEPWALAAVRKIRPGRHFAYIGEGRGGCTGTDGLHRYLATRFDEVRTIAIPQFPTMNDWLTIYRRKG